jgi:hypothetical protein
MIFFMGTHIQKSVEKPRRLGFFSPHKEIDLVDGLDEIGWEVKVDDKGYRV